MYTGVIVMEVKTEGDDPVDVMECFSTHYAQTQQRV